MTDEQAVRDEADARVVRGRLMALADSAASEWTKTTAHEALALLDAKDAEITDKTLAVSEALSRAEQAERERDDERKAHRAFMEEVSEAVSRYFDLDYRRKLGMGVEALSHFILPTKPADPQPDEVWTYKGNDYKVRSLETNHLIQFEDEWHPAVEYENFPDRGLTFYRALPDFLAKFTRAAIERAGGTLSFEGEG